ncbi:MarR family transcriptional regulator [Gemmiger formicilis]|nr:MarR family transcriptional regulator [Gemmiger formicilis]
MPQPQRDGGQQQAAIAAAAVGQDTVTVLGCLIHGKNPLLYSYYKSRKTDTQWQRCTKNCVKICRLDINLISDYNKNPKSDFEKRRPMQEKQRQVYDLLEITNRQFNECNALYHAVAQRCGLSDAAFWVLYALRTTHEPQTQNRMAAEWGQPKQTLNSAVAAMVKKGLVELCPGNGAHSGKIVTLTDEGRALAERTVEPVIAAEQQAMTRQGLAEVEQNCRLTQRYLECLRQEFEKIAR